MEDALEKNKEANGSPRTAPRKKVIMARGHLYNVIRTNRVAVEGDDQVRPRETSRIRQRPSWT